MTTKEIRLRLSLPSSQSDLTCPDGEVASFTNVPWLQALADRVADDDTSPIRTRLNVNLDACGILLPASSEIIAIHSPVQEASDSDLRFLILTSQDALAIYSRSASISYLHASASSLAGKIHKALVFSDFILLLTSKGPRWIIYEAVSDSYTLTTENPTPPQVDFNLSPVVIEGYNLIAGQKPELDVAADIPETLNVSESMFVQWLDAGSGSAVKEDVRQLVFAAVGKSVAAFESMIRARGLYLTAPRCVASLTAYSDDDAVLPTPQYIPTIFGASEYSSPVARLLSWSFHAGTLRLRIQFSLLPMRLSASFNVPESGRIWMRQFRTILFAATDSPRWHDKGQSLSASSLNTWTDPDTGIRNGYAFRFADALTSDQLSLRTQRMADFHIIGRAPVDDALSGMVILSGLNYRDETQSRSKYKPDYRDLTIPEALDGIPTDRGFALFRAHPGIIPSASNSKIRGNTLLASHRKYPFIFRHATTIGNAPITALSRSSATSGRTSTARHPLYVLSSDGIRHIESDSEGEFQPTRLISRLSILPDWPTAQAPDRLYFMTSQGLATLTLGGNVALLDISASSFLDSTETLTGSYLTYCTLTSNQGLREALLLTSPGRTLLYDLRQKRLQPLPSISIRSILIHNSRSLVLLPDGALTLLSLSQTHESEDPSTQESLESLIQLPQTQESLTLKISDLDYGPTEGRTKESNPDSTITTRPIKLGNPFIEKRILSIQAAHPGISITLQASADLINWIPLASRSPGQSSTYSRLHLLPARFFRIILSCPPDLTPFLTLISIRYRL